MTLEQAQAAREERVVELMKATRAAAGHEHDFEPVGGAEMCSCGVSRRSFNG